MQFLQFDPGGKAVKALLFVVSGGVAKPAELAVTRLANSAKALKILVFRIDNIHLFKIILCRAVARKKWRDDVQSFQSCRRVRQLKNIESC
ncbi:hypothetical protein [Lysobacter capsici]|uniref:hypothetical protein n=1 Tax=Lysobacter capsici TaxID=435897 RepID=UPI0012902F2C|nr:hypothetical protein [Lysobacter capsici]